MTKRQFNLRLEEWLLERLREQARVQGVTVTEWVENAILSELGINDDPEGMVETWKGIDRLKKLEYDVKSIKENLETITSRLDSRVDGVWDAVDYISVQLDKLKQQSDGDAEFIRSSQEEKIAIRRLADLYTQFQSEGYENPINEAMKQVQDEMEDF